MFRDLYEIIRDFFKGVITSRLFVLALFFIGMFAFLIFKLFEMQIIDGQDYLDSYLLDTKATLPVSSTRGYIYDRNGKVLAYDDLAYSVTVIDDGSYSNRNDLNRMLLRLVRLLEKHNTTIANDFRITINANGEFEYTIDGAAKLRFLSDIYGLKSPDDLDKNEKHPSDATAQDIFQLMLTRYKLDEVKDDNKELIEMTDQERLSLIYLRYSLASVAYQSYRSIVVASNVDNETRTDILENASELLGVKIEEETIRKYNYSYAFAPIIGYVGRPSRDEFDYLVEQNENYDMNDMVGRTGLEKYMELDLQGQKGSQEVFLDSRGRIREVISSTAPVAGENLHLTIDADLQEGIYKLIERQLAGILVEKIENRDFKNTIDTDGTAMRIPIKEAYFQLIDNNVLSMNHFAEANASGIEQQIYAKFNSRLESGIARLMEQLTTAPSPYDSQSDEMKDYSIYAVTYLKDVAGIIVGNPSGAPEDAERQVPLWSYRTMTLKQYLENCITENYVDTTKLSIDSKYSNTEDIYQALIQSIADGLRTDTSYNKLVYKYLILDGVLTGRELLLAMFDQGALAYDEVAIANLTSGGSNYAYSFFIDKISRLEITPAQLALSPHSGFCVVTNVNTGEVLAMVSYPGYDNNMFSGTVDPQYYSMLQNDSSLPLFNNAMVVRSAPGSIFKPLTAIAGLEEGVVTPRETIMEAGPYETVQPPIHCWVYPSAHGALDVLGALRNSCNTYFSEVGYRMSLDAQGNYNGALGLSKIHKYADMLGLGSVSGIEVENEPAPQITTEDPVRSSIGQGTNAFTSVQLARYNAALANRGKVFDLSMIDKLTDVNGELVEDFAPEVLWTADVKSSTWDLLQTGLRDVITDGSPRAIFADLEVPISGKTGTAQEARGRANHGLFISYGPTDSPEISVTVQIPYGYTSGNAAQIAKNTYRLYYNYLDIETIMSGGALQGSGGRID